MPLYRYHPWIRVLSSLAAAGLMVFIYLESSEPLGVNLGLFPLMDKLVHAGAYGTLATLLLFSQRPGSEGFNHRQIATACLLAIAYGISDEWHQSFVPSRTADGGDVLADAIGACLAVAWLAHLSGRFYRMPH